MIPLTNYYKQLKRAYRANPPKIDIKTIPKE